MTEAIHKQVPVKFLDGRLSLDFHLSANSSSAFLTMFVLATPDDWRSDNFRNKSVSCTVEKGLHPLQEQKVTIASRSNPCIVEPFHLYVAGAYSELNSKPSVFEVTSYVHSYAQDKNAAVSVLPDNKDPVFKTLSLKEAPYDFLAEAIDWFSQYTRIIGNAIKQMEGKPSIKGTRWTLEQDEETPEVTSSSINLHGLPLNLKKVIPEDIKYWDMEKILSRAQGTPLLHLSMGQTTHATFMKEAQITEGMSVVSLNSMILKRLLGTYDMSEASIEIQLRTRSSITSRSHTYILDLNVDDVRGNGIEELTSRLNDFRKVFEVIRKLNCTSNSGSCVYNLPKFILVSKALQLASVPMKEDERNGVRELTNFNEYVLKLLKPSNSCFLVSPHILLDSLN